MLFKILLVFNKHLVSQKVSVGASRLCCCVHTSALLSTLLMFEEHEFWHHNLSIFGSTNSF